MQEAGDYVAENNRSMTYAFVELVRLSEAYERGRDYFVTESSVPSETSHVLQDVAEGDQKDYRQSVEVARQIEATEAILLRTERA